jgi:hypothetical protein
VESRQPLHFTQKESCTADVTQLFHQLRRVE